MIFIFGNVTYFFVNSNAANDNCTLYPNGSMVQLPGDTYRMTIVPKESAYTVSITDNNIDTTNSLERKEMEVTKDGVTTTVVNYIYTLSNVQTGHTLNVTVSPNSLPSYIKKNSAWALGSIYIKNGNSWVAIASKNVFVKQNGSWASGVTTHITNTCFRNGGILDQNAQ